MANYSGTTSLDLVFSSLADPTRRAVLVRLGQTRELTISELAAPLAIQMPTVLKHLGVLDRAGLITRTKTGRTVSVRADASGTKPALDWLTRQEQFWNSSLDRLVDLVEKAEDRN